MICSHSGEDVVADVERSISEPTPMGPIPRVLCESRHQVIKYFIRCRTRNFDFEKDAIKMMIFSSNKCEGAGVPRFETFKVVDQLISGEHIPIDDIRFRETCNLYDAYEYLTNEPSLSVATIRKAHAILMNVVPDDAGDFNGGEFRKQDVFLNHWRFPSHEEVPSLMERFELRTVSLLKSVTAENLIGIAGDLSSMFVQIHPFSDGNGRISRLILNYILCCVGQYPFPISLNLHRSRDRYQYYKSLRIASRGKGCSYYSYLVLRNMYHQMEEFNKKFA